MSSDQGSKERGRNGALLVVGLLLALGAVALLAPDGDGTDAGAGKIAVVTTASGTPVGAPKVDLLPGGTAPAGSVAIQPLGDEAIADVPEGTFFKRAGPEGAVVDARRAATTDEATVRATGLRGRVLTTAGAPVAGARVSLRGNRPDAAGMTIMKFEPNAAGEMELSSPGELRPPEATTDADGAFAFMGLDPSFRFTIHAQPATPDSDLLPAKRPAPALRAGQTVDAGEVRLTRAARLSGTVYGADGRPLPEATVRLGGEDGMMMFAGGEEGGSEGAPVGGIAITKSFRAAAPMEGGGPADGPGEEGEPMFGPGMGGPSAKTDAAGRYTLPRVRPGKHVVTATKPGLRSARREVEVRESEAKDDVDLRLEAGLGLVVEVVDAQGQSIADATVQVSTGFGPGGGKVVKTDAQGRARFDGLSSTEVTIAARAEGFASTVQEARLGPSDPETPRRLALVRGATVTGRLVRDSDGSAVTRGFVMLEPLVHGPNVNVSADGSNRPDKEGRFRLTGVVAGRYRLRAMSADLAPKEVEVTVAEGPGATDVGDVRMGTLATLDVTVLDPDGAPVADARVDAGQGEGGMMVAIMATPAGDADEPPIMQGGAAGRTGPDGRAHLEKLQPGTLSVRATKAPFADGWGEATVSATTPGEITVRLTRPARIEGRLVGAEPGARTRVTLLRKGRMAPIGTAEVVDGAFAFERVSPGDYRLTPSGVQSDRAPEWFTVAEGATVTRTVEAAPTATVSGVVRAADGTVVTGATVAAGWLDAWHAGDAQVRFPMAKATTDVAGRYELKGVLPQPGLGITVTTAQGAKASFRLDVPEPTRVQRDLRLPAVGEAGAVLRVRVATSEGAAAGARVTLERADDGPYLRREAATGPDGVATFEGVPAGRFAASGVAPGCARKRAAIDVGSGASEVEGPTLALDAGGALLLEVVGTPGATGDANLTIRREGSTDFDDTWFTGVDLGGRARIDGLELGVRYEVHATAKGHREARVSLSCDAVDPQAPATIRLEPAQ